MNSGMQETQVAVDEQSAQQFDQLVQQYYHAWFRFHPEIAVDVGVNDYADQLRSYEHDDIGALIALNQKMKSALEELNLNELDARQQTDATLIKSAISIELHELALRDWRFTNPMAYVPVNAIYQLLIHPGGNFHQALKRRLVLIPEYLRGAKVLLQQSPQTVVPNWLDTAVQMCEQGAGFVRGLGRNSLLVSKFTNPARLQPLFDEASQALQGFASFLKTDIAPYASGSYAIGESAFNHLLKQQHFLKVDSQQLLAVGEQLFEQAEEALIQFTRSVRGNENVRAWLDEIHTQHPSADALLNEYRNRMRKAHQWVQDENILTMPPAQSLSVQQTPAFLQTLIPFAAYEPPVPSDTTQQGIYYVTIAEGEDELAEHNIFSIDLTSVHEAFPGHHCQFVLANQNNSENFARQLNTSATLFEGWALYCEDLAVELGMLDSDEHRFIMLRDRMWRALRIIIDVKLHTGQLELDSAASLMREKLGFEQSQAMAEVNWYSSAPTTPMCYAIGREIIVQLRQQLSLNTPEELKQFHDRLLSQGAIALPIVIEQVFGKACWEKVSTGIFG